MIYICPTLADRTALGRVARRGGLHEGLAWQGIEYRAFELSRRWLALPTYFQMLASARTIFRMRRLIDEDRDAAVILEGADIALAYRAAFIFGRRPRARVHVDVCDSVLLLADTNRVGVSSSSFRSGVKKLLAVFVLKAVGSVADSVSYISQRDMTRDARHLGRQVATSVVRMARPAKAPAVRDPAGPFVVIGDWAYSPNMDMLARVLEWMGDWGHDLPERLRVVGPNLDCDSGETRFRYMGWVASLDQGFNGTACALALLQSGAGVKNKVMDSLAFGIPVAGTEEAFNGIPASSHLLRLDDRMGPEDVHAWARSLGALEMEDDPGWGEAIEPMLETMALKGLAGR